LDKTKGDFEDLIKFSLLKLRHYQPPQKSLKGGKQTFLFKNGLKRANKKNSIKKLVS
jgi:hypothetical protein